MLFYKMRPLRSRLRVLFLVLIASLSYAELLHAETDDQLIFSQAINLSIQGDWLAAEKLYRDVMQRQDNWPEVKNNLAIALFKQGKVGQARAMIEQAVVSLPSFKIAQQNRRRLYNHSAAQAYHKAMGSQQALVLPKLILIESIDHPEIQKNKSVPLILRDSKHLKPEKRLPFLVKKSLDDWVKAWSAGNIEEYLSVYSEQFKPADQTQTYLQWRAIRRVKFKFSKAIDIQLDNVEIFVNDKNDQVLAEFVQTYKSVKYKDKTIKQLNMKLEKGRWLILSERVLQQIN